MVNQISDILSGAWRPYPMHSIWLMALNRAKEYSSLQESFCKLEAEKVIKRKKKRENLITTSALDTLSWAWSPLDTNPCVKILAHGGYTFKKQLAKYCTLDSYVWHRPVIDSFYHSVCYLKVVNGTSFIVYCSAGSCYNVFPPLLSICIRPQLLRYGASSLFISYWFFRIDLMGPREMCLTWFAFTSSRV